MSQASWSGFLRALGPDLRGVAKNFSSESVYISHSRAIGNRPVYPAC